MEGRIGTRGKSGGEESEEEEEKEKKKRAGGSCQHGKFPLGTFPNVSKISF